MNTIYYFTGTGNSLDIAKQIAAKTDAELIPVTKAEAEVSGEKIGIAFPIYMFNAPKIVYEFIKKIKSCDYLYIVMTLGGNSGKTTERIKKILAEKKVKLCAGFSFLMPDNYLAWNEAEPMDKQKKLFKAAESRISEVAKVINDKKEHFDDEKLLKSDKGSLPFPLSIVPMSVFQLFCDVGYKMIPKMDKSFVVNDKCNGCETCKKLCPANNITMVDKKPVWNHNCEQCYACIQWCPQVAIDYKKKTIGKKRYQNPHIKLAELLN